MYDDAPHISKEEFETIVATTLEIVGVKNIN